MRATRGVSSDGGSRVPGRSGPIVPSGLPFARRAPPPRRAREEAATAAPTDPLTGDALLQAVNDAMIALHRRYYHRVPATAKTQLIGDEILACVMGGIYTDVEKTMIELQRNAHVKDTRSSFQHAMKDRFIAEVERLSGRSVHTFFSDSHVGPDLQIELFILEPGQTPPDTTQAGPAAR
jgi:uncharacterized protein YbcI